MDPLESKIIHLHSLVSHICGKHQWLGFFELLKGYDDVIAYEISMALSAQIEVNATTMVRGLAISISLELIRMVKTLPVGIQWKGDEKTISPLYKKNFFTVVEKLLKKRIELGARAYPIPRMRWPTIS